MGKFRTKVAMVDAVQWSGSEFIGDAPDWVEHAMRRNWGQVGSMMIHAPRREVWVQSDLGDHLTVKEEDWLVRWSNGEVTIVKRDEFVRYFEPT